ncbi:hypothetical protein FA09DRAFT_47413 [Tilletiopsis washingtonensis]|uniref:Uncharacterized protein n=1 Tax=Tilletiopsis washingtonensis TaxID=58919 RepID=A0A316Z8D6_9BASI|nr:hypothetical protein FA09DRAFT_47413 [Tilletiopsis washingtonensis]PWN97258.1 hypothetical protein FA09DRAFT_47413 [Tilletiopsis washingtonensis]
MAAAVSSALAPEARGLLPALPRDNGEGPSRHHLRSASRSRTPSDVDRKVLDRGALQRPVSEAPSSPLSEVPPSLYESEPEAVDEKAVSAASFSLHGLLQSPGSRFVAPRTEDARRLGPAEARALVEEVVIMARQPLVLTHCDGSNEWSQSWNMSNCRRGLAYPDLLDRGSGAAARRHKFYAAGAAELSETPDAWEARLGKGRDRQADAQRWASNQRRDGFASRVTAVDEALRVLGDGPPTYSYSVRGIVHYGEPLPSDASGPQIQSRLLPAMPVPTPATAVPPMPWDLRQTGDPCTLDVAGNDSIEPLCKAPCAAVQTVRQSRTAICDSSAAD